MKRIKNAKDWVKDGTALFTLNRYEKAIECYDKAIEIDPDDAVVWLVKALALLQIPRRKEEADECIEKSIELDPKVLALFVEEIKESTEENEITESVKIKEDTEGDTAIGEAWMQVARSEEPPAAQQVFHIANFMGEIGRDKQVAGGDIVGGMKRTGDIVATRSIIGGEKAFSNCPYCGEALNLPKTPKFCPYCREQLR